MIEKEQAAGRLQGLQLTRNGPELTHCFFADDSVFFLKAELDNCRALNQLLQAYCLASGQLINLTKSCIYFSRQVSDITKEEIGHTFQIAAVDTPGNYLGLPVLWGRSKVQALNFVIDKVRKKMLGWQNCFLSDAGRETLIKAVINSIPVYSMSCFLFPKSIYKKLNSLITRFWWKGNETKRRIHWVSHDNLCKPKCQGGIGFRDFEHFNLALLAKMGWRILQEPDQIWAKILKNKYFPKCSFLDAKVPANSSWLWKSIVAGRKVLEGRVAVSIGNGLDTKVWHDPWVITLPGNKLTSECPSRSLLNLHVSDLKSAVGWDTNLVASLISEEEKRAIESLPFLFLNRADKWIWLGGNKTEYSVKEGYKTVLSISQSPPSMVLTSTSNTINHVMKQIWKIRTPYKVRNFLWRVMSNAIPTMENLKKRKCADSDICQICKCEPESLTHLFFGCDWVRRVWIGSCLTLRSQAVSDCSGFLEVSLLDCKMSDYSKASLAVILWHIWKQRCMYVYQKKPPDSISTLKVASDMINDYWGMLPPERQDIHDLPTKKWKAPLNHRLKINTDCAFQDGKAAVAFIVRDSRGDILDGNVKPIKSQSAFAAEAYAVLWAFQYVVDYNLDNVTVETDNLHLYNCIEKKAKPPDWESLAHVDNILFFRNCCRIQNCRWIPREANGVADWVARAFLKGVCPDNWMWSVPPPLQVLIANDAAEVSTSNFVTRPSVLC